MRIPFTKVNIKDPTGAVFLRPYLDICLYCGSRNIRTKALIDSGADRTLINSQWAKPLGIELEKGIRWQTYGVAHGNERKPIPMFIHEVEIEIINMPLSRKKIEAGFIDSSNVSVLLGQNGFFDNYRVAFEKYFNFFDIEVKP